MRNSISSKLLVVLVMGLLGVCLYLFLPSGKQSYAVAAGRSGGGYQSFCHALEEVVELNELGFRLKTRESEGSLENLELLRDSEVDLALVQLQAMREPGVRAIATVYNDVVHVLARVDANVQSIEDLGGKKVSVGLPSSGTRDVAEFLLSHYGLNDSTTIRFEMGPRESVEKLIKGEIDTMILVTELSAPVIEEALQSGLIRHVSIGESGTANGLCVENPLLMAGVLEINTYGKRGMMTRPLPEKQIVVLKVPSQLVCLEQLDE